jgi:ABC-type dipeptide/oligopeptide/nickel transport system permease subunit
MHGESGHLYHLTVFAFNILGDALRDVLDLRRHGRS